MKCKHPIKSIWYRWVDKNGFSIRFTAGVNEIKKEYTCIECGKTFERTTKKIRELEEQ